MHIKTVLNHLAIKEYKNIYQNLYTPVTY